MSGSFCASSEESCAGACARHSLTSAAAAKSEALSRREQRGKLCGRLRTAQFDERRSSEKRSFEPERAPQQRKAKLG